MLRIKEVMVEFELRDFKILGISLILSLLLPILTIKDISYYFALQSFFFFLIVSFFITLKTIKTTKKDEQKTKQKGRPRFIVSTTIYLLFVQSYILLYLFVSVILMFTNIKFGEFFYLIPEIISMILLLSYSKEDIFREEILKEYESKLFKKTKFINTNKILSFFLHIIQTLLIASAIFGFLKIMQIYLSTQVKGIVVHTLPDVLIILTIGIYLFQSIISYLFDKDLKAIDTFLKQFEVIKDLVNFLEINARKEDNPPKPQISIVEFFAKRQLEDKSFFVKKWYSLVSTYIFQDPQRILEELRKDVNPLIYKYWEFLIVNVTLPPNKWEEFIQRLNDNINQTYERTVVLFRDIAGIENVIKMLTIILSSIFLNLLIGVSYFFASQIAISFKGQAIGSLGGIMANFSKLNPKDIEIFGNLEFIVLLLVSISPSVIYIPILGKNLKFYTVKTLKLFFLLFILNVIALSVIKYLLLKVS